jgi:redox-sensitive bicupin YhaK (pirin superfamily)
MATRRTMPVATASCCMQAAPARALLIAGKPLGEPIAQYGPFVMNTNDEIFQAVQDYQSGRFAATT